MFVPLEFLSTGVGAVGAAGLLATLIGVIYATRKKIPHPTEFWIIGFWFRKFGCHTHDRFDLVVDVHQASFLPRNQKVYVFVKSGRFENQTATELSDKIQGAADFYERVPIHVRQKDNTVKLQVYSKSALHSELIGEYDLDVDMDLIAANFPRRKLYHFSKADQHTCRVLISLYRVEPLPLQFQGTKMAKSKIVQQAMIQSQLEGKSVQPHQILAMSDESRLVFFSRVLEGPLARLTHSAVPNPWDINYFRATTTNKGIWLWCFWNNKKDMQNKVNPKGVIPILAISAVLRNETDGNRHQFLMRYLTRQGSRDMYLQRVDRDRDIWVDGLYEFIEMVRDAYQKQPHLTEAQQRAQDIAEEQEKRRVEAIGTAAPTMPRPTLTAPAEEPLPTGLSDEERRISTISPRRVPTGPSTAVGDMYRWINDPDKLEEQVAEEISKKDADRLVIKPDDGNERGGPTEEEEQSQPLV